MNASFFIFISLEPERVGCVVFQNAVRHAVICFPYYVYGYCWCRRERVPVVWPVHLSQCAGSMLHCIDVFIVKACDILSSSANWNHLPKKNSSYVLLWQIYQCWSADNTGTEIHTAVWAVQLTYCHLMLMNLNWMYRMSVIPSQLVSKLESQNDL